jgi:hypothetical protein
MRALLACLLLSTACSDRYLIREDALADLKRSTPRERARSTVAAERAEDHRAVFLRGGAVAGAIGPSGEPGKLLVRVHKSGFLPGLIVMGSGLVVGALGAGLAFGGPNDADHATQHLAGAAIGGLGGLAVVVGGALTLVAAFGRLSEIE